MNVVRLQDRMHWGMNVAARSIGMPTDAYRPCGSADPLAAPNRYLRLHAAFIGLNGSVERAVGYGAALWQGVFDAAYTKPGDYLVRQDATWFIAAQQSLLPLLCVQTNRVVTFSRPATQSSAGINTYGGITADTLVPLLQRWPASVTTASIAGRPETGLPADGPVPAWTVLLPATPGVTLRVADLMTDDLGRNAVVSSAELSELGWRVTVRQATT